MKKSFFKSLLTLTIAALLIFSIGCSAAVNYSDGADNMALYSQTSKFDNAGGIRDYYVETEESFLDMATDAEAPSHSAPDVSEKYKETRKIIYSSWYDISTEEYDKSVSTLNALCEKYGAYYENSESYGSASEYSNRRSSFTVRIPFENYKSFIGEAGNIGTVTGCGENNRDVTEEYFDTEARLESAEIREQRLLEILKNADTLDDILLLEKELSDVRYEIENYSGTLKKYDSLISYSTATINITEVKKVILPDSEKQSLWTRMTASLERGFDNFKIGFDNILVAFSYSVPAFLFIYLPLIIVAIVVICVFKRKIKKAKAKKQTELKNDDVISETKN